MDTRQDVVKHRLNTRWIIAVGFIFGYLLGHVLTQSIAAPDPNALKVQGPDTLGNPLPVAVAPPGASGLTVTPLTQSSANAAAANNISLGGAAGLTTYCTGFQITGGGATGASVIAVTLTGTVIQTQNYQVAVPAGATLGVTPLIVTFPTPIPASAVNTAITLNVPSFGAGNTNAAAAIQGFRQ